jgi:ABC-type Co2+ transport system permease subunit
VQEGALPLLFGAMLGYFLLPLIAIVLIFIDVSDAHVGITNVGLNPTKGKNNRLLR